MNFGSAGPLVSAVSTMKTTARDDVERVVDAVRRPPSDETTAVVNDITWKVSLSVFASDVSHTFLLLGRTLEGPLV